MLHRAVWHLDLCSLNRTSKRYKRDGTNHKLAHCHTFYRLLFDIQLWYGSFIRSLRTPVRRQRDILRLLSPSYSALSISVTGKRPAMTGSSLNSKSVTLFLSTPSHAEEKTRLRLARNTVNAPSVALK